MRSASSRVSTPGSSRNVFEVVGAIIVVEPLLLPPTPSVSLSHTVGTAGSGEHHVFEKMRKPV